MTIGRPTSHSRRDSFQGQRRWSDVRIRGGRTYTYDCVPHASSMRGTFQGVSG